MAIVEVSIVPLGVGKTSLSPYVARAVTILRESGLRFELTGMGTIIHGDLDEILAVVRRMHESTFESGVARTYSMIKIDDRRDRDSTPQDKVKSVLEKL